MNLPAWYRLGMNVKTAARMYTHYIDPMQLDSVRKHGLLSLRGMREAGLASLYRQSLDKYRARAGGGDDASVEKWLKKVRGVDWDQYIYAFPGEIPRDAHPDFLAFANSHIPVSFLVPENTHTYEYLKGQPANWRVRPPNNILFQNIPHTGVRVGSSVQILKYLLDKNRNKE